VFSGVVKKIYSTPSPSTPSSPHEDQIKGVQKELQVSLTPSYVLTEAHSVLVFALVFSIPTGLSVQCPLFVPSPGNQSRESLEDHHVLDVVVLLPKSFVVSPVL
jgi:hypothetical protein